MAVVVVIYDSVMYQRTGLVSRWAHSVARDFEINAQMAAPKRSGELAAGIYSEVEMSPAAKTAEMAIISTAPHTLYVVGGTTGPIRASSGRRMPLPAWGGHSRKAVWSVSGQRANNFFRVAADMTAMQHTSLQGFSPTFRV